MAKKFGKTKLLGLFLIAVSLIMVLASCGLAEEIISPKDGTPSDAQEAEKDSAPKLKDKSDFLASHVIEGRDDLIDLSEYVKDGEAVLYSYGFRTENEILLIYKVRKDTGDDYSVKGLDIMTGELSDYEWNFSEGINEYDYAPYVKVCSFNPLVIFCNENGGIYSPERPEWTIDVEPEAYSDATVVNDNLYLIGNKNNIDKVNSDGKIENVVTIPDTIEWIYKEESENDDIIKLSANDRESNYICIEIDPETLKGKSYIQQPDYATLIGGGNGWKYSIEYRDDDISDTIIVTDVRSKLERKLQLSRDIQGEGYIIMTQGALSGNSILFTMQEMEEDPEKLMLWDFSGVEAESVTFKEKEPYEIKEITLSELRDKAKEIDEKYGVTVKYGNDIRTYSTGYRFETYNNKGAISEALTTIDESLSIYPEGFFDTVEERFEEPLVFTLTGTQVPMDKKTSIASTSGLQSNEDGAIVIYLDIDTSYLTRSTLVHEISHVIDQRLIVDGYLDEDVWSSLNPPDFDYYFAYVSEDGEDYSMGGATDDSVKYTTHYANAWDEGFKDAYFIDTYGKTWPTEDRARLFEYLVGSEDESYDDVFKSEHLQKKLEYYFTAIREDFGTDKWPEETLWEKKLNHYISE